MDLDSLYQEIILDHYKNPHGRGLRDPFDGEAHHVNPTCGDEITSTGASWDPIHSRICGIDASVRVTTALASAKKRRSKRFAIR